MTPSSMPRNAVILLSQVKRQEMSYIPRKKCLAWLLLAAADRSHRTNFRPCFGCIFFLRAEQKAGTNPELAFHIVQRTCLDVAATGFKMTSGSPNRGAATSKDLFFPIFSTQKFLH